MVCEIANRFSEMKQETMACTRDVARMFDNQLMAVSRSSPLRIVLFSIATALILALFTCLITTPGSYMGFTLWLGATLISSSRIVWLRRQLSN